MSGAAPRPKLLNAIRTGQTLYVTTLTPDGETQRHLFGFWENADGRHYTITGSMVNANSAGKEYGNYDLYLHDLEGATFAAQMWTDEIDRFSKLLDVTRYVKGTVTGFVRSGDEIKLEYVNPEGQPDTFTFLFSTVAFRWSYWAYRSRTAMNDENQRRYLMLPLPKNYVTDIEVPDDELYRALDEALEGRLRECWMMDLEARNPKPKAADLAYASPKAA